MLKFSAEGRLGLLMEIIVIILERLNVTAGYVIWPLFGLGAFLIADWIWRGEWKQKHTAPAIKKRVILYSLFSFICLSTLAVWLIYRIRYVDKYPIEDSAKNTPQTQTPTDKAKEPPSSEPHVEPIPHAKPLSKNPIIKSKPTSPLTPPGQAPAPQTTINAQNGIGISGGTVTNPMVNNFAPPDRQLNAQQAAQLDSLVLALPDTSNYLVFEDVTDGETQRYSRQIWTVFNSHGKTVPLRHGLSWKGPMPQGIYVAIHDQGDIHYSIAQQIVKALVSSGVQIDQFTEADFVPPGEIRVVIGTRPR